MASLCLIAAISFTQFESDYGRAGEDSTNRDLEDNERDQDLEDRFWFFRQLLDTNEDILHHVLKPIRSLGITDDAEECLLCAIARFAENVEAADHAHRKVS